MTGRKLAIVSRNKKRRIMWNWFMVFSFWSKRWMTNEILSKMKFTSEVWRWIQLIVSEDFWKLFFQSFQNFSEWPQTNKFSFFFPWSCYFKEWQSVKQQQFGFPNQTCGTLRTIMKMKISLLIPRLKIMKFMFFFPALNQINKMWRI